MFLTQVIETEIGDNPVNPGVERTLKAEILEIDVGAQKRFLIDVLAILERTCQMNRQTQHGAVILTHQFLERLSVSLLGKANQTTIIDTCRLLFALAFGHEGQFRK